MNLQQITKAIEAFDETGLGRCLALLATLAEQGMESQKTLEKPKVDRDFKPKAAAEYLGISTQTLKTYRSRYNMKSNGTGKSRYYKQSELDRVIAQRSGG